MSPNPRLELTWIRKENRPRLEPRILLEDPVKSYHAKHRAGKKDIFDNRLIFSDNLVALKALEQEFTGKAKCVYSNPPNTVLAKCEQEKDDYSLQIENLPMAKRLEKRQPDLFEEND
jgi:adenine-specific DNA-methyltransferase